jgi:hypothetical protein
VSQFFFFVSLHSQVESLYPRDLGPDAVSTENFLESGLIQLDRSMEERVRAASSRGNVLRYVCEIGSTGYCSIPAGIMNQGRPTLFPAVIICSKNLFPVHLFTCFDLPVLSLHG